MRAGRDCDECDGMVQKISLEVYPFEMGTDKEAALKPLEEAAEVYGEFQRIDYCLSHYCLSHVPHCEGCDDDGGRGECAIKLAFANELADVVQAACNLAARYDIDLSAAMERCERRNRERGRYRSPQPEMTEGARAILDRMMEGANDE